MSKISTPKLTATTIKIAFKIPLAENDSLINIVEIINPEFLITRLNSSVCRNENNSNSTSTIIKIVKNSSKKTLLTDFILCEILSGCKLRVLNQLVNE